jgi:BirA family biotin operon repressor/biotin-[acetyl-CoA-carboxylase] ligase
LNPPEDIAEALARAGTRLGPFGHQLSWHEQVGSTNDIAASRADSGAAEGLVVAADAQSSGRGRLGRAWASPPGAGLYVSVVLRPLVEVLPLLTIAAGVALAEGIEAASGLTACVKWPNDVYVGGRKLAGILAEAGSSAAGISHIVLGFGINVRAAAYPPDVAVRATSLESELGRPVDRGLVLAECLASIASRYQMLRAGQTSAVLDAWRSRAAPHMRRHVEWDAEGGVRSGVAQDIDGHGALLVRVGGDMVRVIAGEVRWLS